MKTPAPLARAGFTLIEVLLTTVLAAVLLVALWTLLSMYSKSFESGHARTEQSQLARTLLDQISTDLQAAVQSPPAVPPYPVIEPASVGIALPPAGGADSGSSSASRSSSSGSGAAPIQFVVPVQPVTPLRASGPISASAAYGGAHPAEALPPAAATDTMPGGPLAAGDEIASRSLRPAGVFGSDTFLQLDIVQPADVPMAEELDDVDLSRDRTATRAAELKTVVYSFEELRGPGRTPGETIMHLVRREIDWEEAHPAAAVANRRGADANAALPGSPQAGGLPGLQQGAPAGDFDPLLEGDSATSVPEVIHFALRYFDGAAWSEHWDSSAREGMPLAIEVSMQLRSHEEPEVLSAVGPAETGFSEEKKRRWRHPEYRLIIPLAVAERRPSSQSGSYGGTTSETGGNGAAR